MDLILRFEEGGEKMVDNPRARAFPSADEDVKTAEAAEETEQTLSPSYRLAYADLPFLLRDELRPLQLPFFGLVELPSECSMTYSQ